MPGDQERMPHRTSGITQAGVHLPGEIRYVLRICENLDPQSKLMRRYARQPFKHLVAADLEASGRQVRF